MNARRFLLPGIIMLAACSPDGEHRTAAHRMSWKHPERAIISGHSLTDGAYPDQLALIMAGPSDRLQVDAHNIAGSTIATRMERGLKAQLSRPGGRYDIMLVTEQHTLLGNIVWSDTIGQLRQAQDAFITGNPDGRSFLFTSWLAIDDLTDPGRWIAVEEAMAPLWRCAASRVNRSLASDGRKDRLEVIPTAAGLAWLVRQATGPEGVPGLTMPSTAETLRQLFTDDVHPTPVASWFVALLTHAFISSRPAPTHRPTSVSIKLDLRLRDLARQFVQLEKNASSATPEQCRDHLIHTALPIYLAYQRDTQWQKDGKRAAYAKWIRHSIEWSIKFRLSDPLSSDLPL